MHLAETLDIAFHLIADFIMVTDQTKPFGSSLLSKDCFAFVFELHVSVVNFLICFRHQLQAVFVRFLLV